MIKKIFKNITFWEYMSPLICMHVGWNEWFIENNLNQKTSFKKRNEWKQIKKLLTKMSKSEDTIYRYT